MIHKQRLNFQKIHHPLQTHIFFYCQQMKTTFWGICFLLTISISINQRIIAYGENSDEATYRQMVWQQTDKRIKEMNEKYSEYFISAHNQYSDWTLEEFASKLTGGSMSPKGSISRTFVEAPNRELLKNLQAEKDIEKDGLTLSKAAILNSIIPSVFSVDYSVSTDDRPAYIGPVKNQGSCGSCWAFSGIAEIQSYFIKEHKLYLDLSEQQMVDCLPAIQSGNAGCGGGYLDSVGYYSVRFGIALERFYPYTAIQVSCNNVKVAAGPTWSINSYVYVQDCLALADYLINNRPLGICGSVGNEWSGYSSGVMPTCDEQLGGHCVLLVGAVSDGTDVVANNYWKIRNSWGTSWGESGFARLYRDPTDKVKGPCGFCQEALYSI